MGKPIRNVEVGNPEDESASSSFPGQFLVDNLLEVFDRHRAKDRPAVDEKGRRARYADGLTGRNIGVHCLLILAGVDARVEGRRVESELGRMLF